MDNCKKYIEMISCLVDDELSDEQMSELNTHMESCEDCHKVYNAFKGISDSLSDGLVDPPEKLAEGIMYKVKLADKGGSVRHFAFGRFTAIAACLAIIIIAGVHFNLFGFSSNSGVNQELSAAEVAEQSAEESLEIEANELDEAVTENTAMPEFDDSQFAEQSESASGSKEDGCAEEKTESEEASDESSETESFGETSSLMSLSRDNLINDKGEVAPLTDTTALYIFEGEISSLDLDNFENPKTKNDSPVLTVEDSEELSAFTKLFRVADNTEYDIPRTAALYTLLIEELNSSTGTDLKERSFVALYIWQTDDGLFASLENSKAVFKLETDADELKELIYPKESTLQTVTMAPIQTPDIEPPDPQQFDTAKLNESTTPASSTEIE